MMRAFKILILSFILSMIQCRILLNMWDTYSSSLFSCIKSKGQNTIVLKLDSRQFGIDKGDIQNINTAVSAGLQVQPAMTPCVLKTPQVQADRIVKSFSSKTFNKLWVVPWETTNSCHWKPFYPKQNCEYLIKFIKIMQSYNINVGVFTNRQFWSQLFGGLEGCPQASMVQLWWQPMQQEDDQQLNFNSYHKIGGWSRPYMKQVTTSYICGIEADTNYYV